MPTVAELKAVVSADISGLQRGLAQANAELNSFAGRTVAAPTVTAGAGAAGGAAAAASAAQAAQQTEQQVTRTGQALQAFGATAANVGRTLSATVTLPIMGIGTAAAKTAVDFDQSMRNVNSLAKLSETQFDQLKQAVLGVAADPNIRQGPLDLSKSLYDIVSSGFSGKQALDILKISALGASAGMTDTATSSRALMSVLNSGIGGVRTAQQAMDVLFRGVDRGVFSFEQLSGHMGTVLPTARLMGVSLQEVIAAYATMTKQGLSVAESQTALNNLMTHVLRPSRDAKKAMDELGISYGSTAMQGRGLSGWLADVMQKTGGNRDALARIMPELRGMKAELLLTGDGMKMYNADLAAMRSASTGAGATMAALREQNKGSAAQWELVRKQLELAGIQIGTALLPMLQRLIPVITQVAQWFIHLSPAAMDFVVKMGMIGAAIGPVLMVVGRLASVVGMLVSNWGAITAAGGALVTFLTGPVGLAIAAVVAGVVALALAWRNNWGDIQGKTQAVIDWMRPYLASAWNAIRAAALPAWNEISRFLTAIWPPIRTITETTWHAIQDFIIGVTVTLQRLFAGTWPSFVTIVQGVWQQLRGVVETAWGLISGIIETGLKLLSGDWEGAWVSMQRALALVWRGIADIVSGALSIVGGILGASTQLFMNAGKAMMDGLVSGIRSGASGVIDAVRGIADAAVNTARAALGIHSPSTVFAEIGTNVAEGYARGVTGGAARAQAAVNSLVQPPDNLAEQRAQFVMSQMTAAAQRFNGAAGTGANPANQPNPFTELFNPASQQWQAAFAMFLDPVKGAVALFSPANPAYTSAFQGLQTAITTLFSPATYAATLAQLQAAVIAALTPRGPALAGARAGGGPVMGGSAYLVGERGPEVFVPSGSGTIVPNDRLRGDTHVTVHMNVVTPDANSFRRSQGQLMQDIARQTKYHQKRNG